MNCTGTQVVEIKCVMCHVVKDRHEGFAKSQARNPETAVRLVCHLQRSAICSLVQECFECVRRRTHTEPYKGEQKSSAVARIMGTDKEEAVVTTRAGWTKIKAVSTKARLQQRMN